MSRSTRRLAFAAPFVFVAASGCAKPHTINPPVAAHYAEWNVAQNGDTCYAENAEPDTCPPDASCNPPPPMTIACPAGVENGSVMVYQETADGPCFLASDGSEIACPAWEGEE